MKRARVNYSTRLPKGVSARRMLQVLAEGETDSAALAALAHQRLRATPEQSCHALGACFELNPVYRRLVKVSLERLRLRPGCTFSFSVVRIQQVEEVVTALFCYFCPHLYSTGAKLMRVIDLLAA
jgi:hypothetical protein